MNWIISIYFDAVLAYKNWNSHAEATKITQKMNEQYEKERDINEQKDIQDAQKIYEQCIYEKRGACCHYWSTLNVLYLFLFVEQTLFNVISNFLYFHRLLL